ncbi:MAG: CRTAC1 family protein [Rhizobiales bacterium]|nr:CRTAC1 family protein [Hyphomicrobiales bacterium]MBO6700573.1 CRTAC1 family protein [Hyphomicrobiales bacterium]MBO6738109.1 CRTAC1 family protein [Hyphomicrobiales bacterium]MBO6913584.1 CRTAC1 family protein [Hyphomicrobiales bacterium]MBO6955247.1 CRTAC1 family protein [Hyphomicrobiales bacterium]
MRRSMTAGLSVAVVLSSAATASAHPRFEPRPIDRHVYGGGWEHFVGGGLAAFDCNGDNLPELYAAGGENPAQLYLNTSATGRQLSFNKQTPQALALTGVIGAYPLDIDGDGLLDLAILRVGENLLMRGMGDCAFARFEGLNFDGGDSWTTAFSATWETGESLPTLAFGNYVDRTNPDGPFEACDANVLLRPNGDHYQSPTLLTPGYCALSMLFSDWGRQGRADLRISNDRHYYVRGGEEQMWAMDASPRLYGPQDGWQSHQLWGMGIATRDLDGDGLSEVYLTSMGDQRLQLIEPDASAPTFKDAPFESGATAHRPYTGGDGRPSTGWHAVFGDVQNDGLADLFVAKGNVEQMPGSAMDDPNNMLLGQDGGVRFEEVGLEAGIASLHRSRGAVLMDLNLDGREDLAVVNRGAPMELYENVTPETGAWLQVELRQEGINTRAVGAFVEVRSDDRLWTQEVTVGGGHAGGITGALHFGVGQVEQVEVRVHWPDGTSGEWQMMLTGQRVTLTRD